MSSSSRSKSRCSSTRRQPDSTPASGAESVRPLIGARINKALIARNWPDILRIAASIAAGAVAPSQILKKLASYLRQNERASGLREVGRVGRSLFMIDWIMDASLQRRVQIGLNKGEAHHALKPAISFHRRGEIRDRSGEGQHYRIARDEPARRHHHLLEHHEAQRNRRRPLTPGSRAAARIACPCLAAWMGADQPHRRIPMAKPLAQDSTPHCKRPLWPR